MATYFQEALSNMIFETACGASIRSMAARGCTTRQIVEKLDYPMPFERVARAATDFLLEDGILLREPPAAEGKARYSYVQEKGKSGKISYRRVRVGDDGKEAIYRGEWRKSEVGEYFSPANASRRGDEAYISCDFGLSADEGAPDISPLDGRQREFIDGICWEARRMYIRLDSRMEEIARRLLENGGYPGWVYWR